MSMNRGRELAKWFGLCALALTACSGDEDKPLCASGTFCEANMSALQYDCTQSVMCRAQMSHTLEDDPINGCVRATAKLLENDQARQQQFLANYNNCATQVVCGYYQCAQADVASYGESQRARIEHDCAQNIQCQMDSGQMPASTAYQACVSSSITAISTLTVDRRLTFEGAFNNCSNMNALSCAWVNCFIY